MKLYLFIFWLTGVYCKYFFIVFFFLTIFPQTGVLFFCARAREVMGKVGSPRASHCPYPSPGASVHVTAHIVFGEKSTGL